MEGVWHFFNESIIKATKVVWKKKVKREEGDVAVCGGMKVKKGSENQGGGIYEFIWMNVPGEVRSRIKRKNMECKEKS